MKLSSKISRCRACKSKNLSRVLDFGKTPPANEFLKSKQLAARSKEKWFPLRVTFCKKCSLLQLEDVVNPQLLFDSYVYVSSTSPTFVAHFEKMAKSLIKRFNLSSKSLVVDIGSNDGILLKPFLKKGVGVLGIEPASKIARLANKDGITTITDFFSSSLAKKLRKKHGPASLITATNVFAHIDDLDEVINGVKIMLADDGVFMVEAPYLVDFLNKNLFDTVYHEHLSYLAVRPLKTLFERLGMKVFDVEKVASHGGSIRVFVKKSTGKHKVESSVSRYVSQEIKMKLNTTTPYKDFSKRVEKNKLRLTQLIRSLKRQGKTIAAYGAPAKGNTLLNYFKIDSKLINFIVDDSPYKQGLFTPGTHIPVVSVKKLHKDQPDYLLILAWNFAEPIIKANKKFKLAGGKFIIPVPRVKVI